MRELESLSTADLHSSKWIHRTYPRFPNIGLGSRCIPNRDFSVDRSALHSTRILGSEPDTKFSDSIFRHIRSTSTHVFRTSLKSPDPNIYHSSAKPTFSSNHSLNDLDRPELIEAGDEISTDEDVFLPDSCDNSPFTSSNPNSSIYNRPPYLNPFAPPINPSRLCESLCLSNTDRTLNLRSWDYNCASQKCNTQISAGFGSANQTDSDSPNKQDSSNSLSNEPEEHSSSFNELHVNFPKQKVDDRFESHKPGDLAKISDKCLIASDIDAYGCNRMCTSHPYSMRYCHQAELKPGYIHPHLPFRCLSTSAVQQLLRSGGSCIRMSDVALFTLPPSTFQRRLSHFLQQFPPIEFALKQRLPWHMGRKTNRLRVSSIRGDYSQSEPSFTEPTGVYSVHGDRNRSFGSFELLEPTPNPSTPRIQPQLIDRISSIHLTNSSKQQRTYASVAASTPSRPKSFNSHWLNTENPANAELKQTDLERTSGSHEKSAVTLSTDCTTPTGKEVSFSKSNISIASARMSVGNSNPVTNSQVNNRTSTRSHANRRSSYPQRHCHTYACTPLSNSTVFPPNSSCSYPFNFLGYQKTHYFPCPCCSPTTPGFHWPPNFDDRNFDCPECMCKRGLNCVNQSSDRKENCGVYIDLTGYDVSVSVETLPPFHTTRSSTHRPHQKNTEQSAPFSHQRDRGRSCSTNYKSKHDLSKSRSSFENKHIYPTPCLSEPQSPPPPYSDYMSSYNCYSRCSTMNDSMRSNPTSHFDKALWALTHLPPDSHTICDACLRPFCVSSSPNYCDLCLSQLYFPQCLPDTYNFLFWHPFWKAQYNFLLPFLNKESVSSCHCPSCGSFYSNHLLSTLDNLSNINLHSYNHWSHAFTRSRFHSVPEVDSTNNWVYVPEPIRVPRSRDIYNAMRICLVPLYELKNYLDTTPPARQWRRLEEPNKDGFAFTLMCYNLLSPNYATPAMYPYCPSWALDWDYRRRAILDEIRIYNANIICLQEVETSQFEEVFKPELEKLNYDAVFLPKSRRRTMDIKDGKKVDGCAIFWQVDKFEKLFEFHHEFMLSCSTMCENPNPLMLSRVMTRDNVALGVIFETKGPAGPDGTGGRQFCVTTGHIHWNPENCDIKMIQTILWTAELWAYIDQFLTGSKDIEDPKPSIGLRPTPLSARIPVPGPSSPAAGMPVILCGDLNSLPDSGVVEFLMTGQLPKTHTEFLNNGFKYMFEDWRLLEKWAVDGDTVRHRFDFDRAYRDSQGMKITNFTYDFKGMIDYVLFSRQHFRLLGSLDQIHELYFQEKKVLGCPHAHIPSDHFALLVELELKPTTQLVPYMARKAARNRCRSEAGSNGSSDLVSNPNKNNLIPTGLILPVAAQNDLDKPLKATNGVSNGLSTNTITNGINSNATKHRKR